MTELKNSGQDHSLPALQACAVYRLVGQVGLLTAILGTIPYDLEIFFSRNVTSFKRSHVVFKGLYWKNINFIFTVFSEIKVMFVSYMFMKTP